LRGRGKRFTLSFLVKEDVEEKGIVLDVFHLAFQKGRGEGKNRDLVGRNRLAIQGSVYHQPYRGGGFCCGL